MSSSSSMSISGESNVTVSPFFAVPGSPSSSAARPGTDAAGDGRSRNDASATDGESSLFGAGFNFVNSIVGAGIIGMPIALKECGLFTGIFLIIFVAYLVNQSTIIIIECGLVAKKLNLEELCRHLFGVHGYNACSMSMFLFAYGAMIAYLMIIGDTVPIALDYFMGDDAPSRTAVMLVAGFCIVLPLSLLRDMSSLSSTSLLSIAADLFMVLFICARSQTAAQKQDTMFDAPGDVTVVNGTSIAAGLGTISFAFVCQHSSFLVFQSMKEGTLANWKRVSDVSLVIAGTLCLLLGLVGYLAFGDYTQGDIMTNFGSNDELILVARLFLAITMVFTFPMEVFVARHCLISMVHNYFEEKSTDYVRHRGGGGAGGIGLADYPGTDTGRPSDINGVELSSFGKSSSSGSGSSGAALREDALEAGRDDSMASAADAEEGDHEGPEPSAQAIAEAELGGELIGRTDQAGDEHEVSLPKHVAVTLGLWGSALVIAISTENLKVVLALTGALAASMLGYIIPAALYMKTYEAELLAVLQKFDRESTSYEALPYQRVMSGSKFMLPLFMLVFGFVAMLTGVGTVFYEMSSN